MNEPCQLVAFFGRWEYTQRSNVEINIQGLNQLITIDRSDRIFEKQAYDAHYRDILHSHEFLNVVKDSPRVLQAIYKCN